MKIFLILLITLISNSILAEFKLKIDHHGNVVNPISLNKTQIDLQAVEFDKELKFSSELIKQHLKRVSHTGEDHHHHPEFFLHDTFEIDIELDKDQKSIFILQKKKTTLMPIKKLVLN